MHACVEYSLEANVSIAHSRTDVVNYRLRQLHASRETHKYGVHVMYIMHCRDCHILMVAVI